jgi:Ran-binding protein 1
LPPAAQKVETLEAEEEDDNGYAKEEEAQVEFQPLVKLEEVKVSTGEELEEAVFKMRAKLFRWESDTWEKEVKMWKERGTGDVKLLKNKTTGKVRMLMRREKTMKICANFYLSSTIVLKENVGSDRSWVWQCNDFSEEKMGLVTLAIRFANSENAAAFKAKFDEALALNKELVSNDDSPEGEAHSERVDATLETQDAPSDAGE